MTSKRAKRETPAELFRRREEESIRLDAERRRADGRDKWLDLFFGTGMTTLWGLFGAIWGAGLFFAPEGSERLVALLLAIHMIGLTGGLVLALWRRLKNGPQRDLPAIEIEPDIIPGTLTLSVLMTFAFGVNGILDAIQQREGPLALPVSIILIILGSIGFYGLRRLRRRLDERSERQN